MLSYAMRLAIQHSERETMLRRGNGASSAAQGEPHFSRSLSQEAPKSRPLRGLLRLLQGQIDTYHSTLTSSGLETDEKALLSVYRYHGQTLRESQKELEKKKRSTKSNTVDNSIETDASCSDIPHSQHSMPFEDAVSRHKFVAFFVVQGFWNAAGNPCYSAHTLHLRNILAKDYHDVMTTFVLDLGGETPAEMASFHDEDGIDEEAGTSCRPQSHPFCKGTGFCLFPTTLSTSTTLALLQISKIPAIVVLDVRTGRIVASDAILAIERNDSHTVLNRWQSNKSGLSLLQQLGALATCDCAHGPCCSASGGGCCVIQ